MSEKQRISDLEIVNLRLVEALRVCAQIVCRAECAKEVDWHSAACELARDALYISANQQEPPL